MSQWRLFPQGEIPYFTTPEFFHSHPWIDPAHQVGHRERMEMTARAVKTLMSGNSILPNREEITTVADLGCGDGSLLELLYGSKDVHFVGFDACVASIDVARRKGFTIQLADIRKVATIEYDLVILSSVLECLADPHAFLASIESDYLIATSPAVEDGEWHDPRHAWAWDITGYRQMIVDAGWRVITQTTCEGVLVDYGDGPRAQAFQCVTGVRRD